MALVRGGRCTHEGCETRSSYGVRGTRFASSCARHAKQGMVDLKNRLCAHDGCDKHATYGVEGNKRPICCYRHADEGMVDVLHKRCAEVECNKRPSFGARETRTPEYCAGHAKDGMIDVRNKRCSHETCEKHATYGKEGSRRPVRCYEHASEGMINVVGKRCAQEGCSKHPSFGVAGSRCAIFCFRHAEIGMVGVRNKGRAHQGCPNCRRYGQTKKSGRVILCDVHTRKVPTKRCARPGCRRSATHTPDPNKPVSYCISHAEEWIQSVAAKAKKAAMTEPHKDGVDQPMANKNIPESTVAKIILGPTQTHKIDIDLPSAVSIAQLPEKPGTRFGQALPRVNFSGWLKIDGGEPAEQAAWCTESTKKRMHEGERTLDCTVGDGGDLSEEGNAHTKRTRTGDATNEDFLQDDLDEVSSKDEDVHVKVEMNLLL